MATVVCNQYSTGRQRVCRNHQVSIRRSVAPCWQVGWADSGRQVLLLRRPTAKRGHLEKLSAPPNADDDRRANVSGVLQLKLWSSLRYRPATATSSAVWLLSQATFLDKVTSLVLALLLGHIYGSASPSNWSLCAFNLVPNNSLCNGTPVYAFVW